MIAEAVGGWLSNSISILTDAAHMLSDLFGFAIAITALLISRKPSAGAFSYGYHRAEILGALLSVTLIWGLTA